MEVNLFGETVYTKQELKEMEEAKKKAEEAKKKAEEESAKKKEAKAEEQKKFKACKKAATDKLQELYNFVVGTPTIEAEEIDEEDIEDDEEVEEDGE